MTQQDPANIKHKSFTYHTRLSWQGNRAGVLAAEGKPSFRVASPPEFKGEAGVWTPEDLFVAAVDICTLTTFAAFAQRHQLPIVSYVSGAEGMLEFIDGKYRFTRIILRPTIVLRDASAKPQAEKILHDAHEACLIANSIRAYVIIEPTIDIQETIG